MLYNHHLTLQPCQVCPAQCSFKQLSNLLALAPLLPLFLFPVPSEAPTRNQIHSFLSGAFCLHAFSSYIAAGPCSPLCTATVVLPCLCDHACCFPPSSSAGILRLLQLTMMQVQALFWLTYVFD